MSPTRVDRGSTGSPESSLEVYTETAGGDAVGEREVVYRSTQRKDRSQC